MNRKQVDQEMQNKLPRRPAFFKPTNDDWHPCYRDNTVEVSYIGELWRGIKGDRPKQWRVAVWGADDTGYEKDFDNEQEAISMFQRLELYPMINYADVIALGFLHA